MKVTLLKGLFYEGVTYNRGEVIELPDDFGAKMVEKGTAEEGEIEIAPTKSAFVVAKETMLHRRSNPNSEVHSKLSPTQVPREEQPSSNTETEQTTTAPTEEATSADPLVPQPGVQPTPEQVATTLKEAGLDASPDAPSQQ